MRMSLFLHLKRFWAASRCVKLIGSKQTRLVTEHMLIISVLFCLNVFGPCATVLFKVSGCKHNVGLFCLKSLDLSIMCDCSV